MPTEAEVEAGAKVIAASHGIDAPKLEWPSWMGLSRAVLVAAEKARDAERVPYHKHPAMTYRP